MKINKATTKTAVIILCMIAMAWVGFMAGFYEATGSIPFHLAGESALPPSEIVKATIAEVEQTLAPLRDMEYGQGWNCLDYAWEGMRRLNWDGQLAMIARLDLTPDPDHAVLIVPTTDEGWVFIEPQSGVRIYPRAGGRYMGCADIAGVYVMNITWYSINEYLIDVAEGNWDDTATANFEDTRGEAQ